MRLTPMSGITPIFVNITQFILVILAIGVLIPSFAATTFALESPVEIAQSKASGNEVVTQIEDGRDFKGMTKAEVAEAVGEPWRKDTTPVKARYDEKWIYSCETEKGLTYDCVYIYFTGGRVVGAEVL